MLGTYLVPEIGSIVTYGVLSVNQNITTVSILAAGSSSLHTPFQDRVQ